MKGAGTNEELAMQLKCWAYIFYFRISLLKKGHDIKVENIWAILTFFNIIYHYTLCSYIQ